CRMTWVFLAIFFFSTRAWTLNGDKRDPLYIMLQFLRLPGHGKSLDPVPCQPSLGPFLQRFSNARLVVSPTAPACSHRFTSASRPAGQKKKSACLAAANHAATPLPRVLCEKCTPSMPPHRSLLAVISLAGPG